jgi:hypothetical protein
MMVKVDLVAVVGVPLITPVPALRLSPAGRLPEPGEMVQVNPAVPPEVARVWEYAAPTVAFGKEEVLTARAGATVMDRDLLTVCPPLEPWTVKWNVPAVVDIPVIWPVGLRESPGGRPPDDTDHVVDPLPPVAVSVWE